MHSISGLGISSENSPGQENTASERMLAHRAYSAAQLSPPSPAGSSPPASLEFESPPFNPIWAPPAVEIPSCVTWGFLAIPPPEDLPGLAMHAHQMALAVLDVHERLIILEARNKCGLARFFGRAPWRR